MLSRKNTSQFMGIWALIALLFTATGHAGLPRDVKQALTERGYFSGPLDDSWSDAFRTAIKLYQQDNGIAESGRLSRETLRALNIEGAVTGTDHKAVPAPTPAVTTPPPATGTGGLTMDFGSLSNGDLVPHRPHIRGNYHNPGGTVRAWLLVVPHAVVNFHPQGHAITLGPGSGPWQAQPYIGAGRFNNIGENFDLLLVKADQQANRAFVQYLDDSARAQDWPGMKLLPTGAVEIARLLVKRR